MISLFYCIFLGVHAASSKLKNKQKHELQELKRLEKLKQLKKAERDRMAQQHAQRIREREEQRLQREEKEEGMMGYDDDDDWEQAVSVESGDLQVFSQGKVLKKKLFCCPPLPAPIWLNSRCFFSFQNANN